MIYHITQQLAWEQAVLKGEYTCDSLFTEGFIHTSTQQQVKGVYERYYKQQSSLVVLCIDESKLNTAAIFEASTNGELYPHIYDAINLEAVVELCAIDRFLA